MISSRSGVGIEMFCLFLSVRQGESQQPRNSHSLSHIYLPEDHHIERHSLWMLKHSTSLEFLMNIWGFTWFAFLELEWKSAGRTRKDFISRKVFSVCFLHSLFPARQEEVVADWPARLHAVSCQILQTKLV